jgi:3-hydroxymyristoyl/3-hydroxydecanoyl-(acyl carrier protein) dehydratase
MTAWARRAIQVPEDHPTASGHFPGRPVVPGALLLDEVAAALAGPGALTFRAVKFLAPVAHGAPLELLWQSQEGGLCRFEIRAAEQTTVLTGILEGAA